MPSEPIDIRDAWKGDPSVLTTAVLPGAGFSFIYDGIPYGPEFNEDWQVSASTDASAMRIILSHESGLRVARETRWFNEFAAVENKLRFKNTSDRRLPALCAVHSLNLAFGEPALEGCCVISSGGGLHDTLMPPSGFAIRRHHFLSEAHSLLSVELTTHGGRSSNRDLPFFFLQNDRLEEGLFVAFGWSGQWAMQIGLDRKAGTLTLRGKIPDLNIALDPDEEIEGPTVLIGRYQGSVHDGSNRLRRLIRKAYTPTRTGSTVLPAATYSNWYDLWGEFEEQQLKKTIDAAAALGQEYFILDAGWYAGASEADGGFSSGLGNWHEVDRRKLPHGLKPIAEYVRARHLNFGLWFEPERVAEGSQLAKAHPEWILWKHERQPASWFQEIVPAHPFFKQRFGILNLGRPEVQEWVRSMMDGYIKEYDIRYIRHDFNIDPLAYWDANDTSDRRGITQLRYVQGLYSILDWLRERNPDTLFEGCASGGLRMDLEMARRSHVFWISDNHADTAISRFHLHGVNHFLPGNYNFVTYIRPLSHRKESPAAAAPELQAEPSDLDFHSLFGGAFGMGGRIDLWPQQQLMRARRYVEVWKSLRRYLLEDYYPLSPQPGDLTSWSGWQFHDPADQSGFVQMFRIRATDEARRFVLHKLDAQARYRFKDVYADHCFEMEGAEVMREGIQVSQESMSSKILRYCKIQCC